MGPSAAAQKVAGAPTKATSKAPGKLGHWLSKPFRTQPEGHPQERQHRPQGPQQDAVLRYPGRDSNPHGHEGQWLLRPSCLTNSTTRAGRAT